MAQIPIGSQLLPGRGLSTTTGQVFATAIDFELPPAPIPGVVPGQTTRFELLSISDSRSLSQELNVGVSASFKMGFEASAEFGLARSKSVNSYWYYALIRCRVLNPPQIIRNKILKPEARERLVQEGWEAFSAQYGWEYVDGIITGGSYYALLEFQTSSEREKSDVGAKLSAHLGPFKVDAAFSNAMLAVADLASINVSVVRTGGSGKPVSTTVPEMLQEARDFPITARDEPVEIFALTADYKSAVVLPTVPAPNSLPRQKQRDTLEDLGKLYVRLRDYKASVEFILDHLSDFDEFRVLEPPALTATRHQYQGSLQATAEELDEISNRARACAEDFESCSTFVSKVEQLPRPTLRGVSLNIAELEEKMRAAEQRLTELSVLERRNGDLRLAGRLGTTGAPATPVHAGWGGGIRTWDIEAEGSMWCAHDILTDASLRVGGEITWAGDNAPNSVVRLGQLQICWGRGSVHISGRGESSHLVHLPAPFAELPFVTLSLNDPGWGVDVPVSGAGPWEIRTNAFTLLYKYSGHRPHDATFSWIAVGRWK